MRGSTDCYLTRVEASKAASLRPARFSYPFRASTKPTHHRSLSHTPCDRCGRRRHLLQLHGFSIFLESQSLGEKWLWGAVIAGCLLVAVWQTATLGYEYMENRVVTLNTIRKYPRLRYPNITICPKNVDALNFR